MSLRHISTPFFASLSFFEAPQEIPVLPEKSSFSLLSAAFCFCLYLTGQAVLPVSAERACAHGQPAAVITAAACIVQLIIAQYAIFRGFAFPKRVKVLQAL